MRKRKLWTLKLKGGAFDGWEAAGPVPSEWPAAVVAFRCMPVFCEGHVAFNVDDPSIPLGSAVAYQREEIDDEAFTATYVFGDPVGDGDEHEVEELVGAGAPLGDGAFARARQAVCAHEWRLTETWEIRGVLVERHGCARCGAESTREL